MTQTAVRWAEWCRPRSGLLTVFLHFLARADSKLPHGWFTPTREAADIQKFSHTIRHTVKHPAVMLSAYIHACK